MSETSKLPRCTRCNVNPVSGGPNDRGRMGMHHWCLPCRNQGALAQKMARQINREWADRDPEIARAMDELGEPR